MNGLQGPPRMPACMPLAADSAKLKTQALCESQPDARPPGTRCGSLVIAPHADHELRKRLSFVSASAGPEIPVAIPSASEDQGRRKVRPSEEKEDRPPAPAPRRLFAVVL